MKINYHGRKFCGITNTPNGQVSGDTIFHYHQKGNILTANYYGGMIEHGHMLGVVNDDNSLLFSYHHLDTGGHLKSGYCASTPELLSNGKIRLHENWQWTYGGEGNGESIVEEML